MAQPLTPERLAGMQQTPRLQIICRALRLVLAERRATPRRLAGGWMFTYGLRSEPRAMKTKHEWSRVDGNIVAEIHAAALAIDCPLAT